MKPRERVLKAVDHKEPDRVPIDFGGNLMTGASPKVLKGIRDCLGLAEQPDPRFPYFDDSIQKYFGADIRCVPPKPSKDFTPKRDSQGRVADEWGVFSYYDSHDNPLRHATVEDLKRFPWPNYKDPSRMEGVKEYAKFLHEETDYAVMSEYFLHGFFEGGCRLRGYDQFLLDLLIDRDFVRTFFDKMLELSLTFIDVYFGEIGQYVDLFWFGDDAATQKSPYVSVEIYRELVKPYLREMLAAIRKKSKAKIMHHVCGAARPLIPDYIDLDIDILNPIQPEAVGMAPAGLKADFGDRIAFLGGMGLQGPLTRGTPDEVTHCAKELLEIMKPGGGYIFAAVHSLPDDVPPENVVAMFEAAKKYGQYAGS